MTNYEKIIKMTVDELASYLCDNGDCDICPAIHADYCDSHNLIVCSKAMKMWLETED